MQAKNTGNEIRDKVNAKFMHNYVHINIILYIKIMYKVNLCLKYINIKCVPVSFKINYKSSTKCTQKIAEIKLRRLTDKT